jgi:oligopeptide/dipeptide ABC transporter ATP-binding protein
MVTYDGRDLLSISSSAMHRIRGGEIGMVFQDPTAALNPVYTVRRQLFGALRSHQKLSSGELERRAVQALTDVGIPSAAQRLDEYPHQFSGGMAQRVVIAIALASDPKILLADEPTTALDVTTQRQILMLLLAIQRRRAMTLVLVSHSLGVIAQLCDRVAVMYAGQIVEVADTRTLFSAPKHPYTVGLLSCVPDAHKPRGAALVPIPGTVPDPGEHLPGCRFAPRCPLAIAACTEGPIELAPVGPTQVSRCIRTDAVALDAGLFSRVVNHGD